MSITYNILNGRKIGEYETATSVANDDTVLVHLADGTGEKQVPVSLLSEKAKETFSSTLEDSKKWKYAGETNEIGSGIIIPDSAKELNLEIKVPSSLANTYMMSHMVVSSNSDYRAAVSYYAGPNYFAFCPILWTAANRTVSIEDTSWTIYRNGQTTDQKATTGTFTLWVYYK